MKPLVSFFFICGFAFIGCAGEPTAKSLKKCPNGHTTLKDVPIVYGNLAWEGPAAKKWQNLEFVAGGCVSSFDSPKHEVICTTCRFAHSILSTTTPEDGSWTRSSYHVDSFPKPISNLVKSFPVPPKRRLQEPVSFTQSLSDRMELQYEGVGYRTTAPADKLKNDINKWLKANSIKCSFTSRTDTNHLDGSKIDSLEWETEKPSVSKKPSGFIMLHFAHSRKSSWVNATFYERP